MRSVEFLFLLEFLLTVNRGGGRRALIAAF